VGSLVARVGAIVSPTFVGYRVGRRVTPDSESPNFNSSEGATVGCRFTGVGLAVRDGATVGCKFTGVGLNVANVTLDVFLFVSDDFTILASTKLSKF